MGSRDTKKVQLYSWYRQGNIVLAKTKNVFQSHLFSHPGFKSHNNGLFDAKLATDTSIDYPSALFIKS